MFLALLWPAVNSACFGQSLQPFKFQSFTTKNGLPGSEVTSFSEDGNGFLWVATYDGICRFDGFQFRNYRLPVIDSNLVSGSNLILQVQCWKKQVWCLNQLGQFFRLDPSRDVFVYADLSLSIAHDNKYDINLLGFIFDPNRSCFWINDTKGVFRYDPATGKKDEALLSSENRLSIPLLDTNGKLWCSSEAGEICIDPDTKSISRFFEKIEFTAHCQYQSKIWFLGSCDTLFYFDLQTRTPGFMTTNATTFFKKYVPDCMQDIVFNPGGSSDSLMWISTCVDGLVVVNAVTGQYVAQFNTDLYESKGFLSDWVNRSFVTSDGCLWLGTQKGILKIDRRQQYFFTDKISELKELQIFRIRQVLSNPLRPAEKWVATGDGLFVYDAGKNAVVRRFLQVNNSDDWSRIHAMQYDSLGRLWLGTGGGFARMDASGHLKKLINKQSGSKDITDFIPIGKDAFWVRNNAGAGLYQPERGRYFPVSFPVQKDGATVGIYQMNQGLDHSVLFSSEAAIWRIKPSDFNPECRCFPKPEKVLKVTFPNDLIENDTSIWMILPTGLAEFHKQKGTTRVFGEKEGLSNLRVRSMLESRNGQFWMNSDNGLFVFHPEYGRFKKYTEEDGLADNFIPGILSRDNESFYAGFSYAFSSFIPTAKLLKTNIKPCITGVFALDQRLPVDFSDTETPAITVDHAQNILRFEFTCPDFYQSEKITFQFQLEGFDAVRRDAGFSRSAVYTNLDGGNYRFLVWATNADGFQCEQPAVFSLRVVPPFYRTWWFYGLCLLSVGFVFYVIFRYREIQRLRQEQLRLRIARDLHDEVGSTLSSISILSESALRGVQKDLDAARFGNIGEKARAALDSISDIVWSVNPENDSMEKALARMSAYASEMLENVGTELRFVVAPGVESLSLPMEKRKDFYLIFKEAIHNCAKYARATQVVVTLAKEDNILIMSIKDNGGGFEKEQKLSNLGGNGLRNMESRASAIGGDLQVISSPDTGTEVRLSLSLSH